LYREADERSGFGWVVGRRLFTDGIEREVYEDDSGRQYVLGPDGEKVYGQWLPPEDVPVVVEGYRE
jgi:hypothetical protein